MNEEQVRKIIREELWFIMKGNDKLNFSLPVQFADGRNITVGKGVGTQIGTEATQKLAFLGATPLAKQSGALRDINSDPRPGSEGYDNYARAACADINSVLTNLGLASI